MPRLDIKKLLVSHSDRVKSVELHPTEPWVLSSLYNGKVVIRNYETQQVVKSFDVSELPVRIARFVPRKRWVVCGSDDVMIRVYNYNTGEREKEFAAHSDYIRFIAVHPTQPLLLTCSDDLSIKLWNWENNWSLQREFLGHTHFVMQVQFSPKDPNIFVSCSLDSTIRVWNINSAVPNFTLEGHQKGVNSIDFYPHGDKPYLISGSDDLTVKVWDYQTKACIQSLQGHSHNVTVVCYHPKLPFILSASEDQIVNIWNAQTYKLEETLNYGLERVWALSYSSIDTKLAIGYDGGCVVVKLANEDPVASMDRTGKVILAINNEMQQLTIKGAENASDGEKLVLQGKELPPCEIYPERIQHDAKGRFVAVCGDGEYTIYAAVSFKNKTYGNAEEIQWGKDSGSFVIRERGGNVKIFKDFNLVKTYKKTFFSPQQVFGGHLIGVRSNDFICFYDWDTCSLVRCIEVVPKRVYWNETGDYVTLCCDNNFYVIRYNDALVAEALKGATPSNQDTLPTEGDGVADCIEVEEEIPDSVREGQWVGDCFIYTNTNNRLNYYIGGQTTTIAHLDRPHILLGFIPKHNRVYLMDHERHVTSYKLHISVMQYETAIVRGDFDAAKQIFEGVPEEFHNQLARFLDQQGHKELAYTVTKDSDHQFDLAIALGRLKEALQIMESNTAVSDQKWKQLGSIALSQGNFSLAEKCMLAGKDYSGLLLLYTSLGNRAGLEKIATESRLEGKNNIAFNCYFLTGQVEKCIDLLIDTGRVPEAAFFAKTYMPSQVSRVLKLWKADLTKVSERAAEALADPEQYANLFPRFEEALQEEKQFLEKRNETIPAAQYLTVKQAQVKQE